MKTKLMGRVCVDDSINLNESQGVSKKAPSSSKTLAFLLYPDNIEHAEIFAKVISRFDYCYILHDADEKENDFDEHCLDSEKEEDKELIKKKHYHVLTFHPSVKSSRQMAKELGLDPRFVRCVSSRTAMCLYLTHIGDRSKHQYSVKDIVSNRPSIYYECLSTYFTDTEKMEKAIAIIQNKNCYSFTFALQMLSYNGLGKWAIKHASLVERFVYDLYNERRFTPVSEINKPSFETVCSLDGVSFDDIGGDLL